jgi:hypothetical protein
MGKVLEIINISDSSGCVDICEVLSLLDCNKTELLNSLGLERRVWSNIALRNQLQNRASRQRLMQIICIVNFVHKMGTNRREAFLWFFDEKIPAVGGVTAKECVQNDQFEYVMDYLQSIKLGGFA